MKKIIENVLNSKGFAVIASSAFILCLFLIISSIEGCTFTAADDLIFNQEDNCKEIRERY